VDALTQQVQEALLKQYNIRVAAPMAEYVVKKMRDASGVSAQLPVIGGEARTGVPVRMLVDVSRLNTEGLGS
jgi:hypothetical protein